MDGFNLGFTPDREDQDIDFFLRSFVEDEYLPEQYGRGNNAFGEDSGPESIVQLPMSSLAHPEDYGSSLVAQARANHPVANVNNGPNIIGDSATLIPADTFGLTCDLKQNKLKLSRVSTPLPLSQKLSTRTTLKAWAAQNPKIIYPDNATKTFLSNMTGRTVRQVSNWFANYRQRHLKSLGPFPKNPTEEPSDLAESPRGIVQHDHDGCDSSNKTCLSSYRAAPPSGPRTPLSASQIEYIIPECEPDVDMSFFAGCLEEGWDLTTAWLLMLPKNNRYEQTSLHHEDGLVVEWSSRSEEGIKTIKNQLDWRWRIGPCYTAQDVINTRDGKFPLLASKSDNWLKRSESEMDQGIPQKVYRRSSSGSVNLDSHSRLKRSGSEMDHGTFQKVRRKSSSRPVNLDTRRSTDHDGTSVNSGGTGSSGASDRSSISRRGRRILQASPVSQKPYQCRKCFQGFSRASELVRHMRSICQPTERWTCRPIKYQLPTETNTFNDKIPFCLCGSDPWLCSHGMFECWEKAEIERSFYRVDHIKRHLKFTHRLGLRMATINLGLLWTKLGH